MSEGDLVYLTGGGGVGGFHPPGKILEGYFVHLVKIMRGIIFHHVKSHKENYVHLAKMSRGDFVQEGVGGCTILSYTHGGHLGFPTGSI